MKRAGAIHDNGIIEIVLSWTDQKPGVVVKTIGRNIRETKRIGEMISEGYGVYKINRYFAEIRKPVNMNVYRFFYYKA